MDWRTFSIMFFIRRTKLRKNLEEVDKPFLSHSELKKIMAKEFTIKRIAQVRDVFVFCCFTGLAIIDVKTLTP
jgi:hypothetical protein